MAGGGTVARSRGCRVAEAERVGRAVSGARGGQPARPPRSRSGASQRSRSHGALHRGGMVRPRRTMPWGGGNPGGRHHQGLRRTRRPNRGCRRRACRGRRHLYACEGVIRHEAVIDIEQARHQKGAWPDYIPEWDSNPRPAVWKTAALSG